MLEFSDGDGVEPSRSAPVRMDGSLEWPWVARPPPVGPEPFEKGPRGVRSRSFLLYLSTHGPPPPPLTTVLGGLPGY